MNRRESEANARLDGTLSGVGGTGYSVDVNAKCERNTSICGGVVDYGIIFTL